MSWTYTNDPLNVPLDRVRYLIGDLDVNDPQLTDQELNFRISTEGSPESAAIAAVRDLLALYARKVDSSVGDLRISYSQRREQYEGLLSKLLINRVRTSAGIVAGGISVARKGIVQQDADVVQPDFRKGQFDYEEGADEDDLVR